MLRGIRELRSCLCERAQRTSSQEAQVQHEAPADSVVPKTPDEQKPGTPSLVTVLGAVASGLGVLGFVTFAGGVVLWSRFKEMGLPADHALSLVPKPELIATGAEFLVKAMLFSGVVIAVVAMASLNDRRTNEQRADDDPGAARRILIPALIGIAEAFYAIFSDIPFELVVLLLVVAAISGFVVSACARLGTAAYCLIAFLSVGSFAIAQGYEHTSHHLEVLPMAYSRAHPGDVPQVEVGYFVAETADRIIYASVPKDPQNELREFPRNETEDLEVGALAGPDQAATVAARFAYNLCNRLLVLEPEAQSESKPGTSSGGTPSVAKEAKTKICSDEYLGKLKDDAEL